MSRLLDQADELLDGAVSEFVRRRHAEGTSLSDIARELERDHKIKVTHETVRVWAQGLGIDTSRAAS